MTVALLLLGLATPAQAHPARPTVASVTAQLSKLGRDSERLGEAYNKAVIDVIARQQELKRAVADARSAANAYRASQAAVRGMIQQQYRYGDASQTSAVLLSAASTQDFVDRMSLVSVVSARRIAVTDKLRTDRNRAQVAAAAVRALLVDATRTQADLATTRAILRSQVRQYSALLGQLKAAQLRKLQQIRAAEKAAIAAIAAARKKQTAIPAPATTASKRTAIPTPATTAKKRKVSTAATTGTKRKVSTVHSPNKKHKTQTKSISPAPAPSSRAAIAVRFALAQLGKPYAFAASGPRAFDCSGLTMAAWAAAGVSLPHFAAWQYNKGHHVSRSQLEPGDLVFFYHPIGHVGMYIGHGLIVHAPHTGDVVRTARLSNWNSHDYVGATRLS